MRFFTFSTFQGTLTLLMTIFFAMGLLSCGAEAASLSAESLIVIKVGPSTLSCAGGDQETCTDFVSSLMELNRRVRQLELAVIQLQGGSIEGKKPAGFGGGGSGGYACVMTASLGSVFTSRGTSKLDASAKVRQQCEQSGDSFCYSYNIKCEQEQKTAIACVIHSTWHGTFVASSFSRLEATAKVRGVCADSGEALCETQSVQCDD